MNSNDYRMIINGLSDAIAHELARKCSEESEPAFTPDMSDDVISVAGKRVAALRRIRREVEEVAAGYTGSPATGSIS